MRLKYRSIFESDNILHFMSISTVLETTQRWGVFVILESTEEVMINKQISGQGRDCVPYYSASSRRLPKLRRIFMLWSIWEQNARLPLIIFQLRSTGLTCTAPAVILMQLTSSPSLLPQSQPRLEVIQKVPTACSLFHHLSDSRGSTQCGVHGTE